MAKNFDKEIDKWQQKQPSHMNLMSRARKTKINNPNPRQKLETIINPKNDHPILKPHNVFIFFQKTKRAKKVGIKPSLYLQPKPKIICLN